MYMRIDMLNKDMWITFVHYKTAISLSIVRCVYDHLQYEYGRIKCIARDALVIKPHIGFVNIVMCA